jgi:AcrR family transcriptional regulator
MPKLSEEKKAVLESMTREALFGAAVAILEEDGWQGLTIERLAAAAGVAKGTVYNYFRDKREIVYFVAERSMEEVREKVLATDISEGDPVRLLDGLLETLLRHVFEKRRTLSAMVRMMVEDAEMRSMTCDSGNHPALEIREKLVDLFRRGTAEGAFPPIDPVLMDAVLHATLHGIIHEFIVHEEQIRDVDEVISAVKGLVLYGFCRKEPAKP